MSDCNVEPDRFCECGIQIQSYKMPWGKIYWPQFCPTCNDVKVDAVRAEEAGGVKTAQQELLQQQIEETIPARYRGARVEHISEPLKSKLLKLLGTEQGAFLHGKAGRGKTYSLCAIAYGLISMGAQVRRVTWGDLVRDLRDTFSRKGVSVKSITDPLRNCDVLFMEDIGTSTSLNAQETDFNISELLNIIDNRWERCRPTWITSNKSIEQIRDSFDERIASRLKKICEEYFIEGKDRRCEDTPDNPQRRKNSGA